MLEGMDLWSNDPEERLRAASDASVVGDLAERMGATAPMRPWPYGMPCAVNPYVVFLGASPGNSPVAGDSSYLTRESYELPTAGIPHPRISYPDPRHYFDRIRELGQIIIQSRAPGLTEPQTHALLGQLNLGTGGFGQAANAPLEPEYCKWVPDVLLDYLRPSYVILLGLFGHLKGPNAKLFDPLNRLGIAWKKKADLEFPFEAYTLRRHGFRLWRRQRTDSKPITFVLWPQHPSRIPMTDVRFWRQAGEEFARKVALRD
jgi:hypothetical protein